jgi:hypothetical protein
MVLYVVVFFCFLDDEEGRIRDTRDRRGNMMLKGVGS